MIRSREGRNVPSGYLAINEAIQQQRAQPNEILCYNISQRRKLHAVDDLPPADDDYAVEELAATQTRQFAANIGELIRDKSRRLGDAVFQLPVIDTRTIFR